MRQITLYIESPDGRRQTVALENEISVGRTSLAQIVVDDAQLSRVHATIWREGDDLWIADENSTNGTFVNGERVTLERRLGERDEILLGADTRIFVEIGNRQASNAERRETNVKTAATTAVAAVSKQADPNPKSEIRNPKSKIPTVPLLAGVGAFAIIFLTIVALLAVNLLGGGSGSSGGNGGGLKTPPQQSPTVVIRTDALIPVRVIDPLGGEDPEDLDDLISSFEIEDEIKAEALEEVASTSAEDATKPSELNVPIALWQKQKDLAFAPRAGSIGVSPPGLRVPVEVGGGDRAIKQVWKLEEMVRAGYQQPMDFADLAQKRLNKELIELPMATDTFFLDVGGSATEAEFTAFSFQGGSSPIPPGSPKYQALSQLAGNFDGQKYDLNNGRDRRQMRIRLLRMFHPNARPILQELAGAYFQKFQKPLRVTSLTRSMDYQISLNRTNANSFMVRGPGSRPPHTSGCAFDLARKHMTADEQNFVMEKLAEMERAEKLDALIEYNVNACFHVFIYPDKKAPKRS